ncbi:MAG: EutN/CcmL family microcompartment protein [Bifidobacteriaceae bacterium]|jgi:ethanolamine utilization protein EutN|nr:EutN/CcmL family microcompartment protein [Bifidobacteriaceae bacterium]
MLIGTIIGNVWATRKREDLEGCKFMIVEPLEYPGHPKAYPIVAVDMIGGGIGEQVLVVSGSSARISVKDGKRPIDHVIVGIIDKVDFGPGKGPAALGGSGGEG